MDYTDDELEDLAIMRQLRQRLRVLAEAKIAECEAMDPAKNWLDMNRQIKAIMAADRMVIALYAAPPRRNTTKRKSVAFPPPHFPNGEVSSGASRQMTEGSSTAAKTSPRPADGTASLPHGLETSPSADVTKTSDSDVAATSETPPDVDPEIAAIRAEMLRKATHCVNEMTRRCADWASIWPDGRIYRDDETDWQKHTLAHEIEVPADGGDENTSWLHHEILKGCNAIARQAGRVNTRWFDKRPYNEDDPDYWALSANTFTGTRRAPGEQPAPPGLPWWIVRKPPP